MTPTPSDTPLCRADLHVHSYHSRESGDMKFLGSRDCYSPPAEVYRVAKARGMDIVTITDHDSIDGCLEWLDAHPDADDFVIGEEVSCRLPDGDVEVHLGVYGLTEAVHRELQPLRASVFEVTACLRAHGLFFALNHLLHFYRGQVSLETYLRLLAEVPAVEARNGTMLPGHNALIERIAGAPGRGLIPPAGPWTVVGGSDAHTRRRIGTTWTSAPGPTAADFLASLAAGQSEVGGVHGGTTAVAGDIYGVIRGYLSSLLGIGPQDHAPLARALCLAFSCGTLPFQFIPALMAARNTRRQARVLDRVVEALARDIAVAPQDVDAPVAAEMRA